ncbi:hypothetical protein FOZ62_012217 [Perkinsus olseni]|uniref:Uncharacterized protein n=1 Tax=Perkinsus olseni TaxID=32597 RepID=A0A7J6Q0G5_PEROL|nr:hypothetical protein FOZ62_012217 [Perkinsus olseni]
MEIGMSSFERYKGFGDKTKSRGSKKKADLYTMDMIPHNTWWATDDPVSKCRVLRVGEKGETSEYIADVVGDRNCFDNVSFVRDSTLFETGDPSEDIVGELDEICKDGFFALYPFSDFSVLDGIYRGNSQGRRVKFKFSKGKVKDASLTVSEVDKEYRVATHYPLCDGVISIVIPAINLASEQTSSYVILKKSQEGNETPWTDRAKNLLTIPPWRRGRKRLTDIELDPLVTDDVSHDLCRADHVRTRINRKDLLDQWDLDLAEDYGITTQPRPYAFDEGVSESDA